MLKLHFASNSPGGGGGGVSCIEVGRMSWSPVRPSFSLNGKGVTFLYIRAHAHALLLGGYF